MAGKQRYAIDPIYISNVPIGRKTPSEGKPWEGILFCWKIRLYGPSKHRGAHRTYRRFLVTCLGDSKQGTS